MDVSGYRVDNNALAFEVTPTMNDCMAANSSLTTNGLLRCALRVGV